jgi:hypothetical protein
MRLAVAIGVLGLLAADGHAAQHFSNGPERTALIELYTSEGCSSCPPADEWLRALRWKPGLWKEFVPVEFHVNFWDGMGWKDRFSTQEFTQREYDYATAWGSQPYTPCFARNGVQWKPGWGVIAAPGAPMGVLTVDLDDSGTCTVQFWPGPAIHMPADGSFEVHIAVLGGGISSAVTRGENSGSTLDHEFVVLGLRQHALSPPAGQEIQQASVALPRPVVAEGSRRALAAWVTLTGDMEPLQATGGWIR